MSNNKPKFFDREYSLRFGLICVVALSIMILAWTYEFKSNVIVSLNESNDKMFADRFDQLAMESEYSKVREINISAMGQKMIRPVEINRVEYVFDKAAFRNLPMVPDDWGKSKYALDNGKYYILRAISPEYYLQPEMYDDWFNLGISYYDNGIMKCKAGFFATPSTQRIYTTHGSSVETYAVFRSSFCAGAAQAFTPYLYYPSSGETDDGIVFTQDASAVRGFISARFEPSGIIIGKAYPVFDDDWAVKDKVIIDVADGTPKGMYVVSVGTAYYRPYFYSGRELNSYAYTAKNGTALMNFVIAVD